MVLIGLENLPCLRDDFITVIGHLDESCEDDCLPRDTALCHLVLNQIELDSQALPRHVSNQVTELRQDIGTNLDHCLMETWCPHHIKHLDCCILLELLVTLFFVAAETGDHLGHSEP